MLGAPRVLLQDRRSVAALEFALVAPVMAIMTMAVFDGSRALIVWQQSENAAQAVAQAAEKLSVVTSTTNPALTYTQMQNAMSTVYEEIPGLWPGNATGIYPGKFSVTLSEINFYYAGTGGTPTTCASANIYACGTPQYPRVLWSTYLTEGGSQLLESTAVVRPCGALIREYPTWSYTATSGSPPAPVTRFSQMVDPSNNGAIGFVMSPQIIADVQYIFTPSFAQMFAANANIVFVASAMLSTPVGDDALPVTYSAVSGDGYMKTCPTPTSLP
jgi:Flp pilus assembly protein TadG